MQDEFAALTAQLRKVCAMVGQEYVAEKAGVGKATVHGLVSGSRTNARLDTCTKIANALAAIIKERERNRKPAPKAKPRAPKRAIVHR